LIKNPVEKANFNLLFNFIVIITRTLISEMIMNLNDIRNNIDAIDDEILTLLIKRAELSYMVKKLKQKDGNAIFNPARQVNILRRLINNPQDFMQKETIVRIWSKLRGLPLKCKILILRFVFLCLQEEQESSKLPEILLALTLILIFIQVRASYKRCCG
jgi:chorismate mutase